MFEATLVAGCLPPAKKSVGTGFRAVPTGTLLEKGDQYLDATTGAFAMVSLTDIARPVAVGVLVRRIERPANIY